MCWIYIQGRTHICTLYIVYMVFKLSCSVTCHAHVHTTKQPTPVLIHRFTTSRALMLTPQSPKCSQALAHCPPPLPRGPWGPLCNTFDARPISFVLHVTLGCQMSTWVVGPDLSSAQSSFILSKKTSSTPDGTDAINSHCMMYNAWHNHIHTVHWKIRCRAILRLTLNKSSMALTLPNSLRIRFLAPKLCLHNSDCGCLRLGMPGDAVDVHNIVCLRL